MRGPGALERDLQHLQLARFHLRERHGPDPHRVRHDLERDAEHGHLAGGGQQGSGAGVLDTLRRVSIPLMAPSIFSAFLLCFTISAGSFETATMIGLPAKIMVMMSSVYRNVDQVTPPDYRAAAAESALLLAIIMVMVYIYNRSLRRSRRFEVISGKGYSRGRVLSLGRWRWVAFALISGYLVLALALPLFTIVLLSLVPIWNPGNLFGRLSLENFKFLLSDSSGALFALHNSLLASVAAATIVLGVALVIVFAARRTNIPVGAYWKGSGCSRSRCLPWS